MLFAVDLAAGVTLIELSLAGRRRQPAPARRTSATIATVNNARLMTKNDPRRIPHHPRHPVQTWDPGPTDGARANVAVGMAKAADLMA